MYYYVQEISKAHETLKNIITKDTNLNIYFKEKDKIFLYQSILKFSELKGINLANFPKQSMFEYYLFNFKYDGKLYKITDSIKNNIKTLEEQNFYYLFHEVFFELFPENKFSIFSEQLNKDEINKLIMKIKEISLGEKNLSETEIFDFYNTIITKDKKRYDSHYKNNKIFLDKISGSQLHNCIEFYKKTPSLDFSTIGIDIEIEKILMYRFLYNFFIKNNNELTSPENEDFDNFMLLLSFTLKPIEFITQEDIKKITTLKFLFEERGSLIKNKEFEFFKEMLILKKEILNTLANIKICDYIIKNSLTEEFKDLTNNNQDIKNFFYNYSQNTDYNDRYSYEILKLIEKYNLIQYKFNPLLRKSIKNLIKKNKPNEKLKKIHNKYDSLKSIKKLLKNHVNTIDNMKELEEIKNITNFIENSIKNFCQNDLKRIGVYYRYLTLQYIPNDYAHKLKTGERFLSDRNLKKIIEKPHITIKEIQELKKAWLIANEFRNYYFYKRLGLSEEKFYQPKNFLEYKFNEFTYIDGNKIKTVEVYPESIKDPIKNIFYFIRENDKIFLGKFIKKITIKRSEDEILLFQIQDKFMEFYQESIDIKVIKSINF